MPETWFYKILAYVRKTLGANKPAKTTAPDNMSIEKRAAEVESIGATASLSGDAAAAIPLQEDTGEPTPQELHQQGQMLVWEGRLAEGLKSLSDAALANPDDEAIRNSLSQTLQATGLALSDDDLIANLSTIFRDDADVLAFIDRVAKPLFNTSSSVGVEQTSDQLLTAASLANASGDIVADQINELVKRDADGLSHRQVPATRRTVLAAARLLKTLQRDEELAADFAEVVASDQSLSVLEALASPTLRKMDQGSKTEMRSLFARAVTNYGSRSNALAPRVAIAGDVLKDRKQSDPSDTAAQLDFGIAGTQGTLAVKNASTLRSGFVTWQNDPTEAVQAFEAVKANSAPDPVIDFYTKQARQQAIPELPFVGFPRSGSVFVFSSLVSGLGKPSFGGMMGGAFPDFVFAQEGFNVVRAGRGSSHTHIRASRMNLLEMGPRYGIKKLLVMVRDPRQALMSWHDFMPKIASDMDPVQAQHYNLPDSFLDFSDEEQMDWLIDNWLPVLVTWLDEWKEASRTDWFETKIHYARFEDLRKDQEKFFLDILDFFEIDHDLFEMPTEPTKEGDRNFRQGHVDSWRTETSPGQRSRIERIVPHDLLTFYGWDQI